MWFTVRVRWSPGSDAQSTQNAPPPRARMNESGAQVPAVVGVELPSRPHVLLLLVDDLGWNGLGYRRRERAGAKSLGEGLERQQAAAELATPHIDALADEGIVLERHYAFKICAPSRCALQSGRLPVNVNTVNMAPSVANPADPVSGFAGVPRNMTGIATKMAAAGYKTAAFGKVRTAPAKRTLAPDFNHHSIYLPGSVKRTPDPYREGALPIQVKSRASGFNELCVRLLAVGRRHGDD